MKSTLLALAFALPAEAGHSCTSRKSGSYTISSCSGSHGDSSRCTSYWSGHADNSGLPVVGKLCAPTAANLPAMIRLPAFSREAEHSRGVLGWKMSRLCFVSSRCQSTIT